MDPEGRLGRYLDHVESIVQEVDAIVLVNNVAGYNIPAATQENRHNIVHITHTQYFLPALHTLQLVDSHRVSPTVGPNRRINEDRLV